MPHMIPDSVSSDTRSRAEKKLFMKMLEMENTDGWYVLHSVGIANHPTQSQGEADFVVLIPGSGVFTLEVKGGGISFDGSRWYSEDSHGRTHKIHDPVAEAGNASYAFKAYMTEQLPWAGQLMYGFGVVFPDTEIHGRVTFPDLDDDQICDITDLDDIRGYLIGLASHWKLAFAKTGFTPVWPDDRQCAELAQLLRPTFESTVSVSAEIKNLERDIIRLTERQLTVLEGLAENERVLIKGGAGTGKTMLAVYCAEGNAEDGKNVGLFCRSPQLGELFKWAAEEIEIYIEELRAASPEQAAAAADHGKGPETGRTDSVRIAAGCFSDYVKNVVEPHMYDGKFEQLDVLILDEAQDLATDADLEAMDFLLRGGLKNGSWCMFVDSDPDLLCRLHQSAAGIDNKLKDMGTYFTRFTLKENCRNSQAIADTVDELFGMNDQPAAREEYGQEVQFVAYSTMKEQEAAIRGQIRKLLDGGVKAKEIVILSPVARKYSAAAHLENVYDSWKEARARDGILFSTIEDFKSMESPVVIVADCDKASLSTNAQNMYIAMTRARGMLIVNLNSEAKAYLDENRGRGFLQRYGST